MSISFEQLQAAADRAAKGDVTVLRRRMEGRARLACANAIGQALQFKSIPLTISGIEHSALPGNTGLAPDRILAMAQSNESEPVELADILTVMSALECDLSLIVNPIEARGTDRESRSYQSR